MQHVARKMSAARVFVGVWHCVGWVLLLVVLIGGTVGTPAVRAPPPSPQETRHPKRGSRILKVVPGAGVALGGINEIGSDGRSDSMPGSRSVRNPRRARVTLGAAGFVVPTTRVDASSRVGSSRCSYRGSRRPPGEGSPNSRLFVRSFVRSFICLFLGLSRDERVGRSRPVRHAAHSLRARRLGKEEVSRKTPVRSARGYRTCR